MKFKVLWIAGLMLAATAGQVQAAFVSADLHSAGDGLLIEDTTNNMQWVDWSLIPVVSVNDFFSTGTYAGQGFRLATQADIELLFTTAGADAISYNGIWSQTAAILRAGLNEIFPWHGISVRI